MEKYKILPHRADLKIRVFGKTKEELFENAALAMQDCLKAEIPLKIEQKPEDGYQTTILFDI